MIKQLFLKYKNGNNIFEHGKRQNEIDLLLTRHKDQI